MFVLAASFLSYFSLLLYCDLSRPENVGLVARFVGDDMIVSRVTPGSPAARAGLQPEDHVVAVNSQRIRTRLDHMVMNANVDVGQPMTFDLDRNSRRIQAVIVLGPGAANRWRSQEGIVLLVLRGVFFVTLALAIFIAFRRPYDVVARLGAWLLASVAVFSVAFQYRFAVVWREVPPPADMLFWIPFLSSLALPALIFTFFAVLFPRNIFRSPTVLAGVWIPMLLGLLWHGYFGYRMVYVPDRATGVPDLSVSFMTGGLMYVVGTVAGIVVNYRRLSNQNERRRVRVVVVGSLLGLAAGLPAYAQYWLVPTSEVGGPFLGSPAAAVGSLLFLAFPLSFAYAILRHRLFDVSVIIRQGVQYALARRLLLSLVPALTTLLLVDVAVHLDAGVLSTLQTRGWVYIALGVLAIVAHTKRIEWRDSLDRRFFRERYNAQRLLRQVVEDIRHAGDLERVAPLVTAQIAAALHPEHVVLLAREHDEHGYRVLAAAPNTGALQWLRADSKLMALLRLLGKPLEVSLSESGWLRQQLPHEETEFLREARVDLLVPIATDPGRSETILVLGAKRSEEPYSREDRDLLGAITDALALALDGPAGAEPAGYSFRECPECGTCYDIGTSRCTQDGAPLRVVPLQRVLAGRYSLERQLGRGGMATVYAALDTALDRRVAVKVIRDDLVSQKEAAYRFRREARISASLVHPNIVTIHDVGVTADNRAFLVMELLEGLTLRHELGRHRRLPPPRVIAIMTKVCAAVEVAHERHLIHRDLMPENIFLVTNTRGESVKVLDFGIAKALETGTNSEETGVTEVGVLLGTPQYMAPEQLRGEPPTPAFDIWALGIMAYEMLGGVHPFANEGTTGSRTHLPGGYATSIRSHFSDAPRQWQEFFLRALSPNREQRPDSAQTLLTELEQAIST